MSLQTQFALTRNDVYIGRIRTAVDIALTNVMSEATTGTAAHDQLRKDLADAYFDGSQTKLILEAFIRVSITNATIATASSNADPNAAISDSDIQFVVDSAVNVIAGINVNNSAVV